MNSRVLVADESECSSFFKQYLVVSQAIAILKDDPETASRFDGQITTISIIMASRTLPRSI